MWNAFINWCADNTLSAKLQRTVVSGIISASMVALPYAIGALDLPEWALGYLTALGMSLLSPVMAAIGNNGDCKPDEE